MTNGNGGRHRRRGTGAVYQEPSGRWCAAVNTARPGETRRRAKYHADTAREAERLLRDALGRQERGEDVAGGKMKTGKFLQDWLGNLKASQKIRPRTLDRYRNITVRWVKEIGHIQLCDLRETHVQRVLNDADGGRAKPRSVCHWRAVLRSALAVAIRHGYISRNAAALSDAPKVPAAEVRAVSIDDARLILGAVKGDRLEALFTVALTLGLRSGECLGLRWADIDLDGKTLAVQRGLQRVRGEWLFADPKTARSKRTIPLPEGVAASLRQHRSRQLQEKKDLLEKGLWRGEKWGGLVFCDKLGEPLSALTTLRVLRKLLAQAGLPPMKFHELRHGSATLMAAQGIPPRVAMEVLGHSNIATTLNIYTHVTPESTRDALDKMGAALWG